MTDGGNVRAVAFYLPQFHPIVENDQWWGKGFTEWTNVSRARPRFRNHEQPHLPADLGFYDLRLAETRQAQADLAAASGIHGFCYWHYWFKGRRLLERPFDEVLASGEPDFPFMLAWANENWTRAWDGGVSEILLEQQYSEADHRKHVAALAPAFTDDRYIKIDGRPVFAFYRGDVLPDIRGTLEIWRNEARALGVGELYLCRIDSADPVRSDPRPQGFDVAIEFQPDVLRVAPVPASPLRRLTRRLRGNAGWNRNDIYDYRELVDGSLDYRQPHFRFRGVTPGWDNSSRRKGRARIMFGSTPELYERWLASTVAAFEPRSPQENLLFINVWNEWAEGNHLEPDQRWGHAYLDATARVLRP